jgi:hypothetical protein
MTRKYGRTAGEKVGRAMHELKRGELRSGRSKQRVKNPKQAIAIGLAEARRAGAKVPKKPTRRASGRRATRKITRGSKS